VHRVATSPQLAVAALQFTGPQEAAVAKLAYAAEQPGSIALLCGPAGVGKTTVLRQFAFDGVPQEQTILMGTPADLSDPAGVFESRGHGQHDDGSTQSPVPSVLCIDDADQATAADLVDLVGRWRRRQPATVIVLAGEGRLLSLVAGNARLEQSVRLRATLPVFTLAESNRLLTARLAMSASQSGHAGDSHGEAVIRTIHEIAGGIPAIALRLAEMAAMLVEADPGHCLIPDDIETIHRRLSLSAA